MLSMIPVISTLSGPSDGSNTSGTSGSRGCAAGRTVMLLSVSDDGLVECVDFLVGVDCFLFVVLFSMNCFHASFFLFDKRALNEFTSLIAGFFISFSRSGIKDIFERNSLHIESLLS